MPFVATDGPRDDHTKWNKSDREKEIPYDTLICGIKNNDTNEFIYKIETDSQTLKTNLWILKGKGGGC